METTALLVISVTTVAKVLLVAATGLTLASQMSGGRNSVKGLGFYTVYVMLPCLLFTKLVDTLSWELLRTCYAAMIFCALAMLIGYACGQFGKRFVPADIEGHVVLATTFQNVVSFALSILFSIRGVPWLDQQALDEAQSFIFIYNVVSAFFLFGGGSYIIRQALERIGRSQGEAAKVKKPFFQEHIVPLMKNPPIVASILAMVVALTPPLQAIFQMQPLATIMSGLRTVGEGTVPLTLLVLGCNLVGDRLVTVPPGVPSISPTVSPQPQGVKPDRPEVSPRTLAIFVSIVRYIVIPVVLFIVLHFFLVWKLVPDSKVFKLVMAIEFFAPSAINVSILCTLFNYKPKQYTEMLLWVYIIAIGSTTVWMAFSLWYIG